MKIVHSKVSCTAEWFHPCHTSHPAQRRYLSGIHLQIRLFFVLDVNISSFCCKAKELIWTLASPSWLCLRLIHHSSAITAPVVAAPTTSPAMRYVTIPSERQPKNAAVSVVVGVVVLRSRDLVVGTSMVVGHNMVVGRGIVMGVVGRGIVMGMVGHDMV